MFLADKVSNVLVQRAQKFIEFNCGSETELLRDCIEEGSIDALRAVQMLYEDMYDGITFNFELKAPPAYCLLRWGTTGLEALVEAAQRSPTSKNISLTLGILAALAAEQ